MMLFVIVRNLLRLERPDLLRVRVLALLEMRRVDLSVMRGINGALVLLMFICGI